MNLYTGNDPDSGVGRGGVCRCGRGGWGRMHKWEQQKGSQILREFDKV